MGRARKVAPVGAVALLVGIALARASAGHAVAAGFVPYAKGFTAPVYLTSAPGDPATVYVVQQGGVIKIVRNGQSTGTFLDIHTIVRCCGERGLLSMAFSPRYASNHLFYVSYDDLNGNSEIAQYSAANGVADPSSGKIILTVQQPTEFHKGGQLQFDKRGYLYVGFGDGGPERDPNQTAQNPALRLGKLLRSTTTTPNGSWKMVGLGLRNPWRFSFDSKDNLWIGDVGQDHWEEIDLRPAASLDKLANYGWSYYEGDAVFDPTHTYTNIGQKVFPVLVYPHTDGRCAIIGGYVHNSRYYYGDYCTGTIYSFPVGPHGLAGPPTPTAGNVPSLSAFGTDGTGHLYALSWNGEIYELK